MCLLSETWVLDILEVACCSEWTVGILEIFWHQVYGTYFSGNQGCDEMRHNCERNCSHILSSYSAVYFQRSYCTFSKNSLSFDHCRVNFFLQFCSFFALSSQFSSVFDSFFGLIFFYNHSKTQEPFLWNLFFHSFCIYGSI